MIFRGDYVKINKGEYKEQIGKIKGYFEQNFYKVELKNEKDHIIYCKEKYLEKIPREQIEKESIYIKFDDGSREKLKDKNLKRTLHPLSSNIHFKGLYSLGTYYPKYLDKDSFKKDYFTSQIIKLKDNNQNSCEDISKIFLYFIDNSEILLEIINKVNYIIMMPTTREVNQIECWGKKISAKYNKPNLSKIVSISSKKKKVLKKYVHMNPWQREKAVKGAFKIKFDKRIPSLKGKKILILDDVCTTGSQISELTSALAKNGVSEVYALVIGKTVDEK